MDPVDPDSDPQHCLLGLTGVLEHVIGAHPVEDELRLVGHPHNVVLHGVGEEAALVDELYEGQPGVLLQRVLPLLESESESESLCVFRSGICRNLYFCSEFCHSWNRNPFK